MRTFLTLILGASLAGCSLLGIDEAPNVRLTNGAEVPVAVLAREREATNTLDPNPELPRAESANRIVSEGATTNLDPIEGGWDKGDDVRLFLYAAPEGGPTVSLTKTLDVSAKELRRQKYHLRVDSLYRSS